MSYIYDKRIIDMEVIRRFREQGDIIQMLSDPFDLTKDINFWKTEDEITKCAYLHLKDLKKMKAFNDFGFKVDSYDVKGGEKLEVGGKRNVQEAILKGKFTKNDGTLVIPGEKVPGAVGKKGAQPNKKQDDVDEEEDDYFSKEKRKPKEKTKVAENLNQFDKNMFSFGGVNFSRGHELEVSQRKEIE